MYRRVAAYAGLAIALPALLLANSGSDPVYALASAVTDPLTRMGPGELYPHVVRVVCNEGRGTAYRIEGGRLLSVDHVTGGTNCKIGGKPIKAVPEAGLDFSIIAAPGNSGFKINCGGFIPGQWYFAVGFARGWEWQTMTQHLASYRKLDDGLVELLGSPTVIPGMSGGIVMNAAGEAVGMVNKYSPVWPQSFSRALKDTSLCR